MQINRQSHHKPDIPGTEQEHTRGRQNVDGPALGQNFAKLRLCLALAQVLPQQEKAGQPHHTQGYRHDNNRALEPSSHQQHTTEEKAHALQGVLRSGEDGHPFVQSALLLIWHQKLNAALGGHLVQVFGDTGDGLSRHHPRHRQHGRRHRQHGKSGNLKEQPDIHGAVQPHASAQVTTHQVGHHPEELVEDEQQGNFQR